MLPRGRGWGREAAESPGYGVKRKDCAIIATLRRGAWAAWERESTGGQAAARRSVSYIVPTLIVTPLSVPELNTQVAMRFPPVG